jgi:hypothetical protein
MQTWCIDCGTLSPKTGSLYELGTEGWRAMRGVEGSHFEWRCPACWRAYTDVMGDAAVSSARFRAAPPIEEPLADENQEWAQSGERPSYADDATRPDGRASMIARTMQEIDDALATAPASTRTRDLLASAERVRSIVAHWKVAPPSADEQLAVFDQLSRLHADALAFLAATRRLAR